MTLELDLWECVGDDNCNEGWSVMRNPTHATINIEARLKRSCSFVIIFATHAWKNVFECVRAFQITVYEGTQIKHNFKCTNRLTKNARHENKNGTVTGWLFVL